MDILFHSESDNNHGSYSNPEVDRLLEEAREIRDPDTRFRHYNQIEQMIHRRRSLDTPMEQWGGTLRSDQARVAGLPPDYR